MAQVSEEELPKALGETRQWLAVAAGGDAARECATPSGAYLLRLRLLAHRIEAPKKIPETTAARLIFGDASSRLRAALEAQGEEHAPYALAAAWKALWEWNSADDIPKELRGPFEKWLVSLPHGAPEALRWRLALIEQGDHVAAARTWLATLTERAKLSDHTRRLFLHTADFVTAHYEIGQTWTKTQLEVLDLADFLLEVQPKYSVPGAHAAQGVANILLAKPEGHGQLLKFGVSGWPLPSGKDAAAGARFSEGMFQRLKETGTREELFALARILAGFEAKGGEKLLAELHEILAARFPDDSEIVEAQALSTIAQSPERAMGTFERLLDSPDPARRATAMIGVAECARKNAALGKRAVEGLTRVKGRAEGLGTLGWMAIGEALRDAGEHQVALEWARHGLETLHQPLSPSAMREGYVDTDMRRKSRLCVMLGEYLERAGRLEEAMREYKSAMALREDNDRAQGLVCRSALSFLARYQASVDFSGDSPVTLRERFYQKHGQDILIKRALARKLPPLADERAAQAAYEKLSSEGPTDRDSATSALKRMGVAVLPILKPGLESKDPDLRARTFSLAQEIAEGGP